MWRLSNVRNPRVEKEKHYYNADHDKLRELGFRPTRRIGEELDIMLDDLSGCRGRIEEKRDAIVKSILWRSR